MARALFTAVFFVYMVTIPILFLYMVPTCPEDSTFDAITLVQTYCGGHFYEYSEYYIVGL